MYILKDSNQNIMTNNDQNQIWTHKDNSNTLYWEVAHSDHTQHSSN